jgi:hypothetical protein
VPSRTLHERSSMTDEEVSIVTNAIAYGIETVRPGDTTVIDRGTVDTPIHMKKIYEVVAKHVLWTLGEYERQQSERGSRV